MFFDNYSDIATIASQVGFSIFVVHNIEKINIKDAIEISPTIHEKQKTVAITIDDVRQICEKTFTREKKDKFFIIYQPEQMNEDAMNAFLKSLEEPKDNYHFIFITKNLSKLLPTILSRAQIYIQKTIDSLRKISNSDEKTKLFAKHLISINDAELPKLMRELTDKKDRQYILEVVSLAIEMSYKTFLLKNDTKYLKKMPNLIMLYNNITANGNIKLHLVADML